MSEPLAVTQQRVAELERAVERLLMQLASLKAQSKVVLPERKVVSAPMMVSYREAIAHNACLDEVVRLNQQLIKGDNDGD